VNDSMLYQNREKILTESGARKKRKVIEFLGWEYLVSKE
jgi:hypothetical protein